MWWGWFLIIKYSSFTQATHQGIVPAEAILLVYICHCSSPTWMSTLGPEGTANLVHVHTSCCIYKCISGCSLDINSTVSTFFESRNNVCTYVFAKWCLIQAAAAFYSVHRMKISSIGRCGLCMRVYCGSLPEWVPIKITCQSNHPTSTIQDIKEYPVHLS